MANPSSDIERITIGDRQYRAVREGLAQILAPYRDASSTTYNPTIDKSHESQQQQNKAKQKPKQKQQKSRPHNNDEGDQAVFYNPIQQFNRDLSVLAILTYGEGALAEKQAKFAKSQRVSRFKKAKASGVPQVEANEKKRKADDLDDEQTVHETGAKKVKVDEVGDNATDDLEVRELVAQEPAPTVQDDTVTKTVAVNGQLADRKPKQPPFTILDALSASGLRAIRYAKEIPFTTNVIANDLSSEAVKSIELNIDHNDVRGKVHSNVGDARAYMYSKVGNETQSSSDRYVHRFDVIDLDPYGTAAPFLDSAIQALIDGGMLCVTCTDAGVFASNGYPEKAYALYGGVTMKGSHSHEAGLRLILHAVATSAARYGIAIEPLLSLSIDFYARLFIRVHKKQHEVKLLAGTTMITYTCDNGCGAWTTQLTARNQTKQDRAGGDFFKHGYAQGPSAAPYCEHCGYKTHLGGPMWAGPLHNSHFVKKLLDKVPDLDRTIYQTTDRLQGMLTVALEEDLSSISTAALRPSLPKSGASNNSTVSPAASAENTAPDSKIIPRSPPQLIDPSPLFFLSPDALRVLHAATPPDDALRGAIRSLGYAVTRSHCKAGSIKTNAPWPVLWEIMREWVRQKAPIKESSLKPGTAGWRIMSKARGTDRKLVGDILEDIKTGAGKEGDKDQLKMCLEAALYRLQNGVAENTSRSGETDNSDVVKDGSAQVEEDQDVAAVNKADPARLNVVFDSALGREKRGERLVRYQVNPRANWGPMSRAGGGS